MEWPDVGRRIASGEGARTEFKRRVGDQRGVRRTVCAFGNGDGGLIVSGVVDAGSGLSRGRSAGAPSPWELRELLNALDYC